MTTQLKPIKLWGAAGPNPPKVAMILEELGLPHEVINYPFSDIKKPEYLAINPNGRLPTIYDPNTDLTLWESGAIIEYLIERYDTDNKLSFEKGSLESYLTKQWLYFQVTGQGPYYGQAVWFKKYHSEQVPSAVERYIKEINRVCGVLEGYLSQQKEKYQTDEPWLVKNKITYADLAFIQWQAVTNQLLSKEEYDAAKYPVLEQWLKTMKARPAVAKVLDDISRIQH